MADVTGDSLTASAIEQLPFILAVCEGPELRLVAFSAATRAVLPGREALGRPIREVIGDLSSQQITDAYYEVYRTGEPVSGMEWRVHLDMPDGSVHEMWATFTIAPWRHADGTLRGVIGAGFDVTASVRARLGAEEQAATLQQRYDQSRDVITALQRELLPAGLPVLPGVQVAASYLLADAGTAAGGDWYDVVTRDDGRVALIVGDVVGHGVTASGVMGQLRAVLQDRLDGGADLTEALTAADRFARRLPAAHATTLCLVMLDPADGTFTYCTAGHPPPLVIGRDGTTRFLGATGGAPLGTSGTFAVRDDRLQIGDMLLLYSDGILERPGRAIGDGTAELAQVAADSAAGRIMRDPGSTAAERVCTQTVELLVRATGHSDDITLLAAQRVQPVPDLELELPADPGALRGSRAGIAAWLGRLGVTDEDTFLLQHALGELITNAIEHGSARAAVPAEAVVRVHAHLDTGGRLWATVTDEGRWREPARQSMRGRGLALTAQLVDDLRVEPAAGGTVATLQRTLCRPSRMLTDEVPTVARPAPAAREFTIAEDPADDGTVLVAGPVDTVTAERLQHDLLRRGRGGTLPLTVDLTGVTHLASAGVSVLHLLAGQHSRQGGTLTLRAAPGSPAQQVLALIAVPGVSPGP